MSWYESVAFCRWLSMQLGYKVRLPLEEEWERAARGTQSGPGPLKGHLLGGHGREYTWGSGYREGFANINEGYDNKGSHYLVMTTAVGIYPQGASQEGVLDLSSNIWE